MTMMTYSQFLAAHPGAYAWECDAGMIDGHRCLEALLYASMRDCIADDDNDLVIARATVVDDREDG